MEISHNEKLSMYIPLAEFLSCCFGDNVEVVLHDVSNLDNSAVVIFNNHVSGRKSGAPMTEYGLRIIREKRYTTEDFTANTKNILKNGKVLRSSTYFIKDDSGELIGTLCINVDVSRYVEMADLLGKMAGYGIFEQFVKEEEDTVLETSETFPTTVDDLIDSTIREFLGSDGNISDLTAERKTELVAKLNEKGLFMFKGAVRKVSTALEVSEPTVYRYLKSSN